MLSYDGTCGQALVPDGPCMQVTFNPKDTNTFASASLDKTVKVCAGPDLVLQLACACAQTVILHHGRKGT